MPERSTTAAKTPATPAAAGAWPAVLGYALPVFAVALTFGFFLPSVYNGFVDWDDVKLLLENTR
ncbi:MAG TPA: hypothetical protein VGH50_01550, partial [Candidatus Binatia bacterium]